MYRPKIFEKVGGNRDPCECGEDQDWVVLMFAIAKVLVMLAARNLLASWRVLTEHPVPWHPLEPAEVVRRGEVVQ